jgi:CheY-like chemotaxis protein
MSTADDRRAPLVVIVDDEVDIVAYLQFALENHGFRVVAYSEVEAAGAALDASVPDAICLDLLMPKHSGLTLYKKIVESPRLSRCPVMIISGLALRNDLPSLLESAGGLPPPAAIVEKPINIEHVISTLESLLGVRNGTGS